MKEFIKSYIIPIIGLLLTVIFGLWTREEIKNFISNHPRPMIIIALALFVIGYLMGFFIARSKRLNKKSLESGFSFYGLKNVNKNLKRYSVVFVDDMFSNPASLNDFKDRFDNYNIQFLPSVSNIRLLTGFDVIILDIIGAGGVLGNTKPLIKEMFEICPYKYVIALTSNAGDLDDIKALCHVEQKPSKQNTKRYNEELAEKIRGLLGEAFELLDSPDDNWRVIEQGLSGSTLEKESIKRKFEHQIIDSGMYTMTE